MSIQDYTLQRNRLGFHIEFHGKPRDGAGRSISLENYQNQVLVVIAGRETGECINLSPYEAVTVGKALISLARKYDQCSHPVSNDPLPPAPPR